MADDFGLQSPRAIGNISYRGPTPHVQGVESRAGFVRRVWGDSEVTVPERNALRELLSWYAEQCDGDWEHSYGVSITTTDNPGWIVEIDIADTVLEERSFVAISAPGDDDDYLFVKKEDNKLKAACSVYRLEEVLRVFSDWAK